MIPFNKPYLHGRELVYIANAVASGKISGDGIYTKKCNQYFQDRYNFKKILLTTSCTDALEMSAILLNIQSGDEVIVPAYTFVSTANAFALRGANIIFADSGIENPNIDPDKLEGLITPRTKAIVVVHYAGVACDMDKINKIADTFDIPVIEDAAQAIDSFYKGIPLGSMGAMGTFSFHETKNVISGEGGMLTINNDNFFDRAEIIREKGTNRSSFFRGEVDKYGWVDIGSSFLPSDIIAAYLYAQLEVLDTIQNRRKSVWQYYDHELQQLSQRSGAFLTPKLPDFATNNAHMYYMVCDSAQTRTQLISHLKSNGINSVFHYQSLHKSKYYSEKYNGETLYNSDRYTDCLLRLPLFYEITDNEQSYICDKITEFFVGAK